MKSEKTAESSPFREAKHGYDREDVDNYIILINRRFEDTLASYRIRVRELEQQLDDSNPDKSAPDTSEPDDTEPSEPPKASAAVEAADELRRLNEALNSAERRIAELSADNARLEAAISLKRGEAADNTGVTDNAGAINGAAEVISTARPQPEIIPGGDSGHPDIADGSYRTVNLYDAGGVIDITGGDGIGGGYVNAADTDSTNADSAGADAAGADSDGADSTSADSASADADDMEYIDDMRGAAFGDFDCFSAEPPEFLVPDADDDEITDIGDSTDKPDYEPPVQSLDAAEAAAAILSAAHDKAEAIIAAATAERDSIITRAESDIAARRREILAAAREVSEAEAERVKKQAYLMSKLMLDRLQRKLSAQLDAYYERLSVEGARIGSELSNKLLEVKVHMSDINYTSEDRAFEIIRSFKREADDTDAPAAESDPDKSGDTGAEQLGSDTTEPDISPTEKNPKPVKKQKRDPTWREYGSV